MTKINHAVAVFLVVICCYSIECISQTTTQFDIVPAKATVPNIKYRLLPAKHELSPGNSATLYYRAVADLVQYPKDFGFETVKDDNDEPYYQIEKWIGLWPSELPIDEVEKYLQDFESIIRELELASTKSYCDWEVQGRAGGLKLHSLEIYELRRFSLFCELKARLHLAQGKFEHAVSALRTNLAMAKSVGQYPEANKVLTAVAIANRSLDVVQVMTQWPEAPNLYWALSSPKLDLGDLSPALADHRDILERTFPKIVELERGVASDELVDALYEDIHEFRNSFEVTGGELLPKMAIAALYADSREKLVSNGMDRPFVEKMPKAQVVILASLNEFRSAQDEFFKWFDLTFHEASRGGLDAAEDVYLKAAAQLDGTLTGGVLISDGFSFAPDFAAIWFAVVRLERRKAMLRIIESIRHHVATNSELPESLDELALPAPIDPITGKPFEYKRNGKSATIHGPKPAGQPRPMSTATFIVTIPDSDNP